MIDVFHGFICRLIGKGGHRSKSDKIKGRVARPLMKAKRNRMARAWLKRQEF